MKVKSSKPDVIEIVGDDCLMAKKVGTSKITVTFKTEGKTYTKSAVFTVKKYPNPFKSITVNGKTIKCAKNRITYIGVDMKNTKGEIFSYYMEFVR